MSHAKSHSPPFIVVDTKGDWTIGTHPCSEEGEVDMRRLVAAFNACKGIPTLALEGGIIADLLAAAKALSAAFPLVKEWPHPDGNGIFVCVTPQRAVIPLEYVMQLRAAIAKATEQTPPGGGSETPPAPTPPPSGGKEVNSG